MSERTYKLKSFVNLEGDDRDPGGVMVDTYSATMCSCNQAAWVLLRALQKNTSLASLVDALVTQFDVAEEAARKDVVTFVHHLASMGLIDESK